MTEKSSDSEEGYLDGVKPAGDQGAENPASPDRDEDASPKSMLEAVQKAAEPEKTEEGESSTLKEGQAEKAGDAKPSAEAAETGDDGKDDQVPFHKHPRWVEVNNELKTLRPLKSKAEAFDQLHQAMQAAGVTPEEADQAIDLWRLMKTDPAKALATLKPYVASLESYTGEALPDDLKQAVNEGRIDEEMARQVAKDRGKLRQTEAVQQRSVQEAARNAVSEAATEADRLWTDWKATDPDFKTLEGPVLKGFKLRLLEAQSQKRAINRSLAAEFFNSALTEAREERRKLMPRREEVNPKVPSGSGGVPGTSAPTTLLEAMQQGAAGNYVPA